LGEGTVRPGRTWGKVRVSGERDPRFGLATAMTSHSTTEKKNKQPEKSNFLKLCVGEKIIQERIRVKTLHPETGCRDYKAP